MMVKIAANLTTLFTEHSLSARFGMAKAFGFSSAEVLWPYELTEEEFHSLLVENELELALINAYSGDWGAGQRGICGLRGFESALRESVEQALSYLNSTGCDKVHVLSGLGSDPRFEYDVLIENLKWAAQYADKRSVTIMIEPISSVVPGYSIDTIDKALKLIKDVGEPNLSLQLDLFHCQREGLDPYKVLRDNLGCIRHIQLASYPDRCEPETSDFSLLNLLDALGYDGFVGCEYSPKSTTEEGLHWLDAWHKFSLKKGQ